MRSSLHHVLAASAIIVLAGCISPPNTPVAAANEIAFAISHVEASEKTVATVSNVAGDASWADMRVIWNGKEYRFGSTASFAERWFEVDGRRDAAARIENGDTITIIAAGLGTLQFVEASTNRVIAGYDALIPDNNKPAAPLLTEPANGAAGVTRTPAWRWNEVVDPSGTAFTLQWSLDPLFTVPLTTSKSRLTAPQSQTQPEESLEGGQKYYWRASATDGAGNLGAWSDVWSFTTAGGQLVL